jgi:uncharacterized protein (DUF1684 family)
MMVNFKKLLQPGNILKLAIVVTFISILYNVYTNTYEQQILKIRKEKDHYFRTSINSPISGKEEFEGLAYFDPDPKYNVAATMKQLPGDDIIDITSSDGRRLAFKKFAIASFLLNGRNYSLLLLKNASAPMGDDMLFLPFSDKTCGEETYMGGRYIDIKYSGTETIQLDFNQAYHPYCLYNYKYSCPVPPPENYLDTQVKAGEKIKHMPVH